MAAQIYKIWLKQTFLAICDIIIATVTALWNY